MESYNQFRRGQVEERLKKLFTFLKIEAGKPILFSHQTLADALLVTRESITRAFTRFKDQGFVGRTEGSHHYHLTNPSQFSEVLKWAA